MNEATWDKFQLQDYVNRFTEHQRDDVLKQIVESELLEQVLSTSQGRVLLNGIVDDIANKVGLIISLSISGDKDRIAKIEAVAQVIAVSRKAIYDWATILANGDGHKEQIKKVKK